MRYDCYIIRGKYKLGNLDITHISCGTNAYSHELLPGPRQMSTKGLDEDILTPSVCLVDPRCEVDA